jgi:WG containing repeat
MKKIITGTLFIFTLCASAQSTGFVAEISYTPSLTGDWIKVYNEGHIGYVDENGGEVTPPVYEEIGSFGEYCDESALMKRDGLYGLIDISGNIWAEAQYEEIGRQDEYKPGWILVKREGLYGFIDCSGREIVPATYTQIGDKSDTLKLNADKLKFN